MPALSLISYMTLGWLLNIFESPFPHSVGVPVEQDHIRTEAGLRW